MKIYGLQFCYFLRMDISLELISFVRLFARQMVPFTP
jgi:hypothetical protein